MFQIFQLLIFTLVQLFQPVTLNRIAIVVSMKGSRSEKDPNINSFLQENVVNLRRRRILFCK